MKSLDPRVNRLSNIVVPELKQKTAMDQWGTFEVFVQPKAGKAFQHEGAVHAADIELAFVLAKETFTRRFLCTSLFVAATQNVFVTAYTEDSHSIYDEFQEAPSGERTERFEIFHLLKRGKQHVHAGQVIARDHHDAILQAYELFKPSTPVFNVWVICTADIRFTTEEESDLWLTLPEKKFRDASDYKGGEKLARITERN